MGTPKFVASLSNVWVAWGPLELWVVSGRLELLQCTQAVWKQ